MLTACWSVKGGSGTTVTAATLALAAAPQRAVVVDLEGDIPAALGIAEPSGPGARDWLAAGADVPDDALARLVVTAGRNVEVLACGAATTAALAAIDAGASVRLVAALRSYAGDGDVVIDAGRALAPVAGAVVASSDRSLLVLRPCYLALRRAAAAPRPTGVIVVAEPDRALTAADVEEVLGVPVLAEVPYDAAIARAVDAGLLASRLPRRLVNPLRSVDA